MVRLLIGPVVALMVGSALGAAAQARADEFHGNSAVSRAPALTDPAVCRDPQIAQIERQTGTVAAGRVTGPAGFVNEAKNSA